MPSIARDGEALHREIYTPVTIFAKPLSILTSYRGYMSSSSGFDIRKSVVGANYMRLIIVSAMSIGLISWGVYLTPPDIANWLKLGELEKWSGWGFFGVFILGTGIFNLFKESVFLVRSIGSWGEWHFRLTHDHLTWDVPEHAHGAETGFRAKLTEIREIEFRTIQGQDTMDKREYWVHFWEREPIELKSYTSLSLSWLVSKIKDAGVQYSETYV